MKITKEHRKKLKYYLDEFYKRMRKEKFTILHLVRYFRARQNNNKDAWMAVCGETGSGKSLLVLMAMILQGKRMDLVQNVCYMPKGQEIKEKFTKMKMQCLLIDEAAREMRAVNWQSKQQQAVNVQAMTDRYLNNWVFLVMPNFLEFTKSMRRGNIQFRLIVLYRTDLYARAILQRRMRNWRTEDPWCDIQANKIYENYERKNKDIDNQLILSIERGLPNYVMDFMVPNLELILPDVTEEYVRLKMESRKVVVEEEKELKKNNKWKNNYKLLLQKMTKLLYHNTLGIGKVKLSKKEYAKALNISYVTFDKYLKMKENPKSHLNIRKSKL